MILMVFPATENETFPAHGGNILLQVLQQKSSRSYLDQSTNAYTAISD